MRRRSSSSRHAAGTKKTEWQQTAEAKGLWGSVRVYDSRDLHHWLDETPAVALWFADLIGVAGPGVEAPEAAWRHWADQTRPAITEAAFQSGRETFATTVADRLLSERGTFTLAGDSREEVVAFLAAVVRGDAELQPRTVVVTAPDGWRFVDANPDIAVAIAATEDVARAGSPHPDRLLVVPNAAGGILSAPEGNDAGRLPRPDGMVFRDALVQLGLDPADADRSVRHCGRSWAVWRRLNAGNPTIRHPAWLDRPEARVLSTLVLVGAWNAGNETDQAIVAEIAGRDYSDIEADLRALVRLNDPAVLSVGHAWRAKAPLELMHLWGDRLTAVEIDRFLAVLRRILETPDPQLDLPNDQRWAAAVYRKTRRESGALIDAMLDSLVKLSVRGTDVDALAPLQLDARIARLVDDILRDADRTRWLSVSGFLSELAEAAPDAFLRAVETGLRREDDPVTALIAETARDGTPVTGRCWHADLLWALERLAWAPQRLGRVADILARLSRAPKPGNWSNTPARSLKSLFRSWWPQVTVPLSTRLAVLDRVVRDHPDVGWELLVSIGCDRLDMASANAAPKWRDDDAGAVGDPDDEEVIATLRLAHDRMIGMASGVAPLVATLIEHVADLHPDDALRVWALAEAFTEGTHTDEEREVLCAPLRYLLYWHKNFDKRTEEEVGPFLTKAQTIYDLLQPHYRVVRHRWLFASDWFELPEENGYAPCSERRALAQRSAIVDIVSSQSWPGVTRLIDSSGQPWLIGHAVGALQVDDDQIVPQVTDWLLRSPRNPQMRQALGGLVHALDEARCRLFVDRLLRRLAELSETEDIRLALFHVLPFRRETWTRVEEQGEAFARRYWETSANGWCHDDADAEWAAERLLTVGRPCHAFTVLRFTTKRGPSSLLVRVLEGMLQTTEPVDAVQRLDGYRVREALDRLAGETSVDDDVMIRLEFGFSGVGHDDGGYTRIHSRLARDPNFFMEFLTLRYRPENVDTPPERSDPAVAKRAFKVLHAWRRVPGSAEDGTIDPAAFSDWIAQALDLSEQRGYRRVAQSVIGQVLAHAPADPDGVWPCSAPRDVLDHPDHEEMRSGLQIGLFNKRGVTSRSPDEGGAQERALATRYRAWAEALAATHWRLAETLKGLADSYEKDGETQDRDAAWHGEA